MPLDTRAFLRKYAYVYCYVVSFFLLTAAFFRQSVESVSSMQELHTGTRIVIDAGHGGIDGGTTSVTGVLEKELNLQIARRLEKLLLLLGQSPEMTRTTGDSVATEGDTIREQKRSDLKNRLTRINRSPNTILVSIHQNHYPDSRYTGPQVFHAADDRSRAFAQSLQQRFNDVLGTRRECKPSDGVYLMSHLECPGVLVECGFLSSYEEEAKLRTPEHQKKLCCILAAELMAYTHNGAVR